MIAAAPRSLARLALLVVVALGVSGCCRRLRRAPGGGEQEPDPPPVGSVVNLGDAVHPPGNEEKPIDHQWVVSRLKPNSYRLGYALASKEESSIHQAHLDYAKKVRFQDEGDGKFRWFPPPGCEGDIHCVFDDLAVNSRAGLEPIIQGFLRRAKEAKLSSLDLAELMVSFVQQIRYEIPKAEPFGVLAPALVVSQKRGDCDSKSLLLHIMLHAAGIDSVLVSSEAHRHSMLGVALPAQGTTFTTNGRQYAFTETTAKGSPIGFIDPKLLKPNDWRPVAVRVPGAPADARPPPSAPVKVKKGRR
jgi:hypothetical protein